ncbi:hypothetical protein D3C80_1016380 [compost metagenome]
MIPLDRWRLILERKSPVDRLGWCAAAPCGLEQLNLERGAEREVLTRQRDHVALANGEAEVERCSSIHRPAVADAPDAAQLGQFEGFFSGYQGHSLIPQAGLADPFLQGRQLADGVVTVVGDSDNSFSSRWVKFGSRFCMTHAGGGGRSCGAAGGKD